MKVQSKKDKYVVETITNENVMKVMKFINPKCHYSSDWRFVIKHTEELIDDKNLYDDIPSFHKDLPVISFEEWQNLPDKEFVLPEKWYIIIDEENCEYLNKYLHINKDKYLGYHKDWKVTLSEEGFEECTDYFYSESKDDPSHSSFLKREGFIEITFDQFREHVLGEVKQTMNLSIFNYGTNKYETTYHSESWVKPKDIKTIIGYKLIKPEYLEAVNCICHNRIDSTFIKENTFESGSFYFDQFSEAGVMHWFEEVYEKESITLKSGVKLSEDDIAEVKEILNTGIRNNNLI